MSGNGDLYSLMASMSGRDQAIERVTRSVESLANDFSRKLDEAERDTRKQFDTFGQNIANQFQNITNKFETAMAGRDAKFEAFSTKVLEGGRAQWPLILLAVSVGIAILGALGGLAYAPIAQQLDSVKVTLDKLADNQTEMRVFVTENFVSQKHLDGLAARGQEDRMRQTRQIEQLQNSVFPREVHEQRWARFDSDIAAANLRMDTLVMNLQREIDVIQKSLGDTFTARDALLENKERIAKLEELIRQLQQRPAP